MSTGEHDEGPGKLRMRQGCHCVLPVDQSRFFWVSLNKGFWIQSDLCVVSPLLPTWHSCLFEEDDIVGQGRRPTAECPRSLTVGEDFATLEPKLFRFPRSALTRRVQIRDPWPTGEGRRRPASGPAHRAAVRGHERGHGNVSKLQAGEAFQQNLQGRVDAVARNTVT